MDTVHTIAAARRRREADRAAGRRVALVPTMGALHPGHLRLVERARELADAVWASVFVNPAQFGPGEDFERYPRDLERDRAMLESAGVEVLFAPAVEDMYPRAPVVRISFSGLDEVLCGAHRPGHFAGVGLVVTKLLNIVQPEVAVFGQKDAQQALLIRRLVEDLDLPVAVEIAPTVREPDGLAMSSRNAYLAPVERRAAGVLHRALEHARERVAAGEAAPDRIEAAMRAVLASEPLVRVEYVVCVDPETLRPPARVHGPVLLAVAARVGTTRLIDNATAVPPGD